MKLKIKRLTDAAKVPTHGSICAAGWDLYAAEDADIAAGQTALIGTGIAAEIPAGYFGAIYARSGLATKQGLRPANCVGVIDSDYRGEIKVALHNDSLPIEVFDDSTVRLGGRIVKCGDRIAQLVLQKFESIDIEEVDELSDTERGQGGFGSTGSN